MKVSRKLFIPAIFILLFFAPWLVIKVNTADQIIENVNDANDIDALIILGAHVTDNEEPTEILRERLDAALIFAPNAEKIVVSNTERPALIMREYLVEKGIAPDRIEIDSTAEITSDTCKEEKAKYPDGRNVLFLTQGFHLPRTLYLCNKHGIHGFGFAVEHFDLIDRSSTPLFTKYKIRTQRYVREAGLIWAAVMGFYK